MSSQQNVHHAQQFGANIRIIAQQKGSRLRGAVTTENIVGDRAYLNTMSQTAMVPITDRHGKTQVTDTPMNRRMVVPNPFEKADLVDDVDLRRMLTDPSSTMARDFGYAAGRQMDDVIIGAFAASAATGQTGGTSVALPSGNRIDALGVVGGATHASGAGRNFALSTLVLGRQVLEAYDNDSDDMDFSWHVAWRSVERRAVFSIATPNPFTSSDYATVKALVNGELNTFLGFNFHRTERLLPTVGGTTITDVPFWVKASMVLGIAEDARITIKERVDLRESMQVRAVLDVGASRLDEVGVVIAEVNTTYA